MKISISKMSVFLVALAALFSLASCGKNAEDGILTNIYETVSRANFETSTTGALNFEAPANLNIDIDLWVSQLDVRFHDADYVKVTTEVMPDFDRIALPAFAFSPQTETLEISQPLSQGRGIIINGTANLTTGVNSQSFTNATTFGNFGSGSFWDEDVLVNIRTATDVTIDGQRLMANGEILVSTEELLAKEGVTFFDPGTVILYLPRGTELGNISINSGTSIELSGISINSINMDSTNAGLFLDNVNVNQIDMRSTNGGLTAANSEINQLESRTTNGGVTLTNVTLTSSATISTTNGGINFADVNAMSNVNTSSTNGSIIMTDSSIAGRLVATVTNGWVRLTNVDTDMTQANISSSQRNQVVIN
ncbi:MAG: DUF4097 domain-containing protein [Defluviitaleaceae bacterium]|nr:DUF4097 domain-containing protein [Defluviitaleaceae bacterium]